MKKGVIILSVVIPAYAFLAQAGCPTSFSYDFNNGIPEEITLVDADGLKPSQDVEVYGFKVGLPWVGVRLDDSHYTVAASTSWYATSGTSSDWMILPPLKVENDKMILKWAARAHDSQINDGYAVYVSEGGANPEDFDKSAPLFSIEGEKGTWKKRQVSLAAYAGKEIRIAFVNNSTDKALLYIDDIVAEQERALDADRMIPGLLKVGETLEVQGEIYNNGKKDLVGIYVDFTIDGKTYSEALPKEDIMSGWSMTSQIATEFTPTKPGIYPYALNIKAGNETLVREGELYVAQRNVVVEEGTGTWCGYCPRGTVAIQRMNEKYPDQFIGVAVHVGNDPMVVDGYSVSGNSYPVCIVNRLDKFKGSPSNMEDYFLQARESGPAAAIFGTASYSDENKEIRVNSSVAFAETYPDANFGIAYILKENDVHVDSPEYMQMNYFSGGDEEMGGYENLPNPVLASDMWYQEVARLQAGGYNGFEGSIPSYIGVGEPIRHECAFAMPENVLNVENVELVGVIVDNRNGEIVNASLIPMDKKTSVDNVELKDNVTVIRQGSNLKIVTDGDIEEIRAYSVNGSVIAVTSGSDMIDLAGVGHGVVILQVKANGEYHHFKIVI